MAQKKAFVRYAANKAVPGSLIVRTKAPKVGTWKEVPYDVCCGEQATVRLTSSFFTTSAGEFTIIFASENFYTFASYDYEGATSTDWINYFNIRFSWMGIFSINPEDPDQVFFDINVNIYNALSNGDAYVQFFIGVP